MKRLFPRMQRLMPEKELCLIVCIGTKVSSIGSLAVGLTSREPEHETAARGKDRPEG
jgi:hypothetical protein